MLFRSNVEGEIGHLDAALAALGAGCDMVLLCNQSVDGGSAVDELIHGLQREVEHGRVALDAHSHARRLALLPRSAPLAWDELMLDPVYRYALECVP